MISMHMRYAVITLLVHDGHVWFLCTYDMQWLHYWYMVDMCGFYTLLHWYMHGGHVVANSVVAKRCTHEVVTLLVHGTWYVDMWLLRGVHMQWLLVHGMWTCGCTHAVVTLLVHVDMWLLRGIHMQWSLYWYMVDMIVSLRTSY